MTSWEGPEGDPKLWGEPGDPHPGRCRARSKTTGGRCRARAAKGARTCRRTHSGGIGGRPAKHGRFAFKSSGELAEANARWLEEAKALDLTDHLAALAAITQRCITRCEERETPEFRRRVLELVDAVFDEDDPKDKMARLSELRALARRGVSEDRALQTLTYAVTNYSKRVETAKHLDLQEKTTITQRQAEALVGGIITLLQQQGELGAQILKRLDREVFQRNGIRIAG